MIGARHPLDRWPARGCGSWESGGTEEDRVCRIRMVVGIRQRPCGIVTSPTKQVPAVKCRRRLQAAARSERLRPARGWDGIPARSGAWGEREAAWAARLRPLGRRGRLPMPVVLEPAFPVESSGDAGLRSRGAASLYGGPGRGRDARIGRRDAGVEGVERYGPLRKRPESCRGGSRPPDQGRVPGPPNPGEGSVPGPAARGSGGWQAAAPATGPRRERRNAQLLTTVHPRWTCREGADRAVVPPCAVKGWEEGMLARSNPSVPENRRDPARCRIR